MAVVSGTVKEVLIVRNDDSMPLKEAIVFFSLSGTYAQADNGIVSAVPTAIAAKLRDGKTVTMKAVSVGQIAKKSASAGWVGMKTVAISSSDITFELTHSTANSPDATAVDLSTEFTDATAVPAMNGLLGIRVMFTSV